ncbi:MAG: hypothetical protein HY391_03625 [Deltaproteobacteria bacterium]|nr:hypothetical protein [Deltaproteobacteria bacterium]
MCRATPRQTEGPFYPVDDQLDKDTDLTWVEGRSERATGQIIYVEGVVMDPNCQPIEGALVEIWQACESGRYNHPGDRENPAPLDPNFQYWGRALSDREGKYLFKTIVPGSYPAGPDWIRPSHIHFKIQKRGFLELITQMYFAGDPLNDKDLILQRLSQENQRSVIVELNEPTSDHEPGSKVCRFNITLRRA